MKKRILSTLIAVMIMATTLSGCGLSEASSSDRARGDRSHNAFDMFDTSSKADECEAEAPASCDVAVQTNNGVDYYASEECCDDGYYYDDYYDYDTSEFSEIVESGFCNVRTTPLSTFGADVDTASYTTLRSYINWGYDLSSIPTSAIRTEEMLNYFSYNYEGPEKGEPFGVNAEISECPWNEDAMLLMLGLQTEEIDFSDAPDTNLVFLIDVSGSMYDENKLPLLKQSFGLLIENLGRNDRVSIVTYAGSDEIVLEGARGNEYGKIMTALEGLEAGGSTNGGEGIISAYDLAEKYFIEGGNNRVILATDGDFNVGITSQSELYDLIDDEKETGVFLSVLGFGMGNYSDSNMETLADHGNGNYAYIDSLTEAKKVLVEELGATLVTVAKDVKLQVEFNPAVVSEYRLIGYENRSMAAEDFDDDTKDGGEIGAGHSVTVMYEIILAEDSEAASGLRYQDSTLTDRATDTDEWLTLAIRYKEPDGDESRLLEYPIGEESYTRRASDDFRFASAVVEFAMVLRDSEYAGTSSLKNVVSMVEDIRDLDEYQAEFLELVKYLQ